jgi:arginase
LNRCLKLIFPQWQGAGEGKELYDGALEIRDCLMPGPDYEQIGVSIDTGLTVKRGIRGYDPIVSQLKEARHLISEYKPAKIFTVGGDCSVEIAPVSYLNRLYNGSLAVVWLDAHGDLNTPESSPSRNFHGMPLRCLLGEGDEAVLEQCFSALSPKQVVMAGCRELDRPEEDYIQANNIPVVRAGELGRLNDVIGRTGFNNLYVHVDLDVIDPGCFPAVPCPAENGISPESLAEKLKSLKNGFNIVGFGIVEYSPNGDKSIIGKLKELVEFGYGI